MRRTTRFAISGLVLVVAAGCGKKAPADPDQLPFIAGNPWSAYSENEATAERQYKGKRVEVTGTVLAIEKPADDRPGSVIVLKMTPQVRDLTRDAIRIETPPGDELA